MAAKLEEQLEERKQKADEDFKKLLALMDRN